MDEPPEGEKLVRLGLKREPGFVYSFEDGEVWATPRKNKKGVGPARKVATIDLELDYATYLYYFDEDGDFARAPRGPEVIAPALNAFSWGYEGWGPYTRELVELFDRVEKSRGFEPSLFVDVRRRRAVRAPGFREKAFEQLMGPGRHTWMPDLGNMAIEDKTIGAMTIANPAAAAELLVKIEEAAANNRRVIFFCSCNSPISRHTCHRGLVTKLLVAAARERKVSLMVQEWPGGEPELRDVDVSKEDFAALKRHLPADVDSRTTIAIPEEMTLEEAGALPHFSIVRCVYDSLYLWAVCGSAVCTGKGWRLPVYAAWAGDATGEELLAHESLEFQRLELTPFDSKLERED